MNQHLVLHQFLEGLLSTYKERVVEVDLITSAMIETGLIDDVGDIENDHIAFRTIGVPHLGINSLEKVFLAHGYEKRDYMYFEEKKLNAYWYSPPSSSFPRIFISELIVERLPSHCQDVILHYTNQVTNDPIDEVDLNIAEEILGFLEKPLWGVPTLGHYKLLSEESEYAAWVIYNRYYLNHYTISVHNLPAGYNTMEGFVEFVKGLRVPLNQSGGVIKVSKDGLLKQSSTMAGMLDAVFADGEVVQIPGSYVEFAERKVKPQYQSLETVSTEHRRDGFETTNADKIFESTYTNTTS